VFLVQCFSKLVGRGLRTRGCCVSRFKIWDIGSSRKHSAGSPATATGRHGIAVDAERDEAIAPKRPHLAAPSDAAAGAGAGAALLPDIVVVIVVLVVVVVVCVAATRKGRVEHEWSFCVW
jgi:hypothetical protein